MIQTDMLTTAPSHYRARYYDPNTGRFLSEDPIRLFGGINFYAYVRNNSTNHSDPSGKWVSTIHYNMTEQAALNSGYTPEGAAALAQAVVNVDFAPGSQSTDFEWANLHAMSGKKPNGIYQSCFQAYSEAVGKLGKLIDDGSPNALALALHLIQDSYSPAHQGYPEWHGGIPSLTHMIGDTLPGSALNQAAAASQHFLHDFTNHSSALKHPGNYLQSNACGCDR